MTSNNEVSFPGAMPPPPGVTADIHAPRPSLVDTWIASLAIAFAVPTVLGFIRVYARRVMMKTWTWADTMFVLSWALFVCEIGLAFQLINYGIGQHAWNVAPNTFAKYAEVLNIQQIIYMPSICFTKMTILLQLAEIFAPNRSCLRWRILLAFAVFNFIFFTILFFIEIFQCLPRQKIWHPETPGHCINIQQTFIATGVINVVEDFAILALPLIWITKLQTSSKRKASLSALFAVGIFACCSSVLRLAMSIKNVSNPDITVSLFPVALWAMAELSAGLCVACLPYVPKLFHRAGPATRIQPSLPTRTSTYSTDSEKRSSIMTNSTSWNSESITDSQYHSEVFSGKPSMHVSNVNEIWKTLQVDQTSVQRDV